MANKSIMNSTIKVVHNIKGHATPGGISISDDVPEYIMDYLKRDYCIPTVFVSSGWGYGDLQIKQEVILLEEALEKYERDIIICHKDNEAVLDPRCDIAIKGDLVIGSLPASAKVQDVLDAYARA